jgi:hypothetical protein
MLYGEFEVVEVILPEVQTAQELRLPCQLGHRYGERAKKYSMRTYPVRRRPQVGPFQVVGGTV